MAIKLRKKAPYWCRTRGLDGKPSCLAVLTEADRDLCPTCQADADALVKKASRPIPRIEDAAPVVEEPTNWRPSGRTGPIWPGYDPVDCGMCGHSFTPTNTGTEAEVLHTCPKCAFQSEPCDFPDTRDLCPTCGEPMDAHDMRQVAPGGTVGLCPA